MYSGHWHRRKKRKNARSRLHRTKRNVIIAVIFFCIPSVREYTGVCVFPYGETSRPDRPKSALVGCSKDSKRTQQGRFDVDPPIRDICRYEDYFGGICAHLRNPPPAKRVSALADLPYCCWDFFFLRTFATTGANSAEARRLQILQFPASSSAFLRYRGGIAFLIITV